MKNSLLTSIIFISVSLIVQNVLADDIDFFLCENTITGPLTNFTCTSELILVNDKLMYEDDQEVFLEGEYADANDRGWDTLYLRFNEIPQQYPILEIIADESVHSISDNPEITILGSPSQVGVFNKKLHRAEIDFRTVIHYDPSNYFAHGQRELLLSVDPSGGGVRIDRIRLYNSCGDKLCEFSENSNNCCIDCGCDEGMTCSDNVCYNLNCKFYEKPKKSECVVNWELINLIIYSVMFVIIFVVCIATLKRFLSPYIAKEI